MCILLFLVLILVVGMTTNFYPKLAIAAGLVAVTGIAIIASFHLPEAFLILALGTNFMKSAYIPGLEVGEFGATPYMIFTAMATIGFGIQILAGKRPLILPASFRFLLVFIIFTTLSVFIAQDFRLVFGTYARTLLEWMLFFSVVQMLTNRRRVRQLVKALLIQAVVITIWGIIAGIKLELTGRWRRYYFFWQQYQKNDFAAYLGIVLLLAVATYILARKRKDKFFASFLIMLVPIGWIFTFSRGGLLAIIVCLTVFSMLGRSKKILRTSFVIIVLIGLLGFAFTTFAHSEARDLVVKSLRSMLLLDSKANRFTKTIDSRLVLAKSAVKVAVERPFLGVGFNQWYLYSPFENRLYDPQAGAFRQVGLSIHNRLLAIGANRGLIALIGYMGFVIGTLLYAFKMWNFAKSTYLRVYLQVFLAAVVGMQVALLFAPSVTWEWPTLGILTGIANLINPNRR